MPFVILAFTFGHCNHYFDFAVLEIEHQGYKGVALFIYFCVEFFNFIPVQQQFAGAKGIVVAIVGMAVGTDVHLVNKNLTVFYPGIGVLQVGPSRPQGFDLAALQHNSGFIGVLDKIIVPCFSVFGYFFLMFGFQIVCPYSHRPLKPVVFLFSAVGRPVDLRLAIFSVEKVQDFLGGILLEYFSHKRFGIRVFHGSNPALYGRD